MVRQQQPLTDTYSCLPSKMLSQNLNHFYELLESERTFRLMTKRQDYLNVKLWSNIYKINSMKCLMSQMHDVLWAMTWHWLWPAPPNCHYQLTDHHRAGHNDTCCTTTPPHRIPLPSHMYKTSPSTEVCLLLSTPVVWIADWWLGVLPTMIDHI